MSRNYGKSDANRPQTDQPDVCKRTNTADQTMPPRLIALVTTAVQTDEDIGKTIRQYEEEIT